MPDATGLELIAKQLRDRFIGINLETSFHSDQAVLITEPDHNIELLEWLRDTPEQSYNFLSSLHAADYLPKRPRFGVHYELLSMERAERIGLKVLVDQPEDPEQLPALRSAVDIYPTANFQEREAYDMFGIEFEGHPDLRRILMPEEYEGWPQRRDFPMGGEPVQFTFNIDDMNTPPR